MALLVQNPRTEQSSRCRNSLTVYLDTMHHDVPKMMDVFSFFFLLVLLILLKTKEHLPGSDGFSFQRRKLKRYISVLKPYLDDSGMVHLNNSCCHEESTFVQSYVQLVHIYSLDVIIRSPVQGRTEQSQRALGTRYA